MRILANTLFSAAIGCTLLMQAFEVPQRLAILAFFCVALSAILTNLMWIRSVGLVGIGGMSFVFQQVFGIYPAGTFLVGFIDVLIVTAVILMVLADFSYHSKGKANNEVSES